jgi:hypothetical protein
LLAYHKTVLRNKQRVSHVKKAAVVVFVIMLGCLFACSSDHNEGRFQTSEISDRYSSNANLQLDLQPEIHLQEALINTFTLNWFDEIRRFEDIVKDSVALDRSERKSPEYLLGYIDSDLNTRSNYLKIIFNSQTGLNNKIISKNVQTDLADFSIARTNYLQNLQKSLIKSKKVPADQNFQSNSQKLAKLMSDLFVSVSDLRNEDTCLTFQHNLENAAAFMKAAFPSNP